MDKDLIINKTVEFAKEKLSGDTSGHDWWHVYRVWHMSKHIAGKEDADLFVVELAALLHDIADWKFHNGNDSIGSESARAWLEKMQVEEKIISQVCEIIKEMSFKGSGVKTQMQTKEGMIVQDADRLDALGAVGIARAFATGQKFNQELYNPDKKPLSNMSKEQYRAQYTGEYKNTTINHFYEKLLLLKDLMNTKTAKDIAESRHKYMEQFLDAFLKEWNLQQK